MTASPPPYEPSAKQSCGCEVRQGVRVLTCEQHDDPDYSPPPFQPSADAPESMREVAGFTDPEDTDDLYASPPSTPSAEPPKRRFSMVIEADGDDTARLSQILSQIDFELWFRPNSERHLVSGGGYSLRIIENPEGLTGDDYDAALAVWFQSERASKRSASPAPAERFTEAEGLHLDPNLDMP